MAKYQVFISFFVLILNCKERPPIVKDREGRAENAIGIPYYSKTVEDSFSIFVSLPPDYKSQENKIYPVVFLLDANLYFDIIAITVNKYAEVGLAPSVILVGIGYKDFPTMDSLRNRDDTYPIAIPEYEMSVSGGAEKFLSFITNELTPYIDDRYKTDTSKRVLMGHSLGGYFTSYALLQNLRGTSWGLSGFVAASPSLHYNHYYLLNQLKQLGTQKQRKEKLGVYITYGGLEDDESEGDSSMLKLDELSEELAKLLSEKQSDRIHYKCDIYSNLGHMDSQIPTFIKGLRWVLENDK